MERVVELLAAQDLPVSDLNGEALALFFGCEDPLRPTGVVGLEIHGRYGLLRSLVVEAGGRNSGRGRALVASIEAYAKEKRLTSLYLLTNTAEAFFLKRGYERVGREEVPMEIRETSEFRSLCPSTAVVMKKSLENRSDDRLE
jgi:amino-acid N-acetyltransferase